LSNEGTDYKLPPDVDFKSMRLYAASVRRIVPRGARSLVRPDERLVFVLGSPRSGTTFLAEAIGAVPGFVDLGEVAPLKAAVPQLYGLPEAEVTERVRRTLDRIRRLSLIGRLRAVEQTPETAFILPAALAAFPQARAVHIVRDGRDVVCSLLERGWLSAKRAGSDDAGLPYGARARFWVEPERSDEFERTNEATRAAWAWRRYVTAARSVSQRTLEVRYESLAGDRRGVGRAIAEHLDVPLEAVLANLAGAHAESVGRYRSDLSAEQLADVEREAGPLLRELGYGEAPPPA
jgi:hypothetical protein